MNFHFLEVLGVNLFNMKTMAMVIFFIFAIIAIGYLIGKISIKGVTLGSAAIFIVAPQQRSKRIIIQQQEELFSLQEHPPPQFVADKSLIGLPPKFHLHCYPMQGGLGDLHKKMKKKTEIFYLHIDREYTIILTAL